MTLTISDDALDVPLPIPGLQFEQNNFRDIDGPDGWFTAKLMSSEGPLISDFVTHEIGFVYSTYGIHVGQDDRLTFMGRSEGPIVGHFVDCRADSATRHDAVAVRFNPSLRRRLVVPKGVAHTFDNLDGIVTRDEPVWYSSYDNDDWDINNDLVSVLRQPEGTATFPLVRVNDFRLPDELHRFQSRLSQSVLETPMSYSSRFLLTIGSEDTYVMFQAKSWIDNEEELRALLDLPSVPGVEVKQARYALTGARSWTLVPSTGSCVADVLVLPGRTTASQNWFLHRRTRKWYTFLTNPGNELQFDFVDYRPNSPTYGVRCSFQAVADPRISFAIDPGVAYSVSSQEELLVRCEHEVFVAADEPRGDLPAFGGDLIVLPAGEPPDDNPALPTLRCPDDVIRTMARAELEFSELEIATVSR